MDDRFEFLSRSEKKKQPVHIADVMTPGIISIVCIPEDRAWFLFVENCYFEGGEIMLLLSEGVRKNKELLQDYKKHGLENDQGVLNFDINFEAFGSKYHNNPQLIEETMEKCKKT